MVCRRPSMSGLELPPVGDAELLLSQASLDGPSTGRWADSSPPRETGPGSGPGHHAPADALSPRPGPSLRERSRTQDGSSGADPSLQHFTPCHEQPHRPTWLMFGGATLAIVVEHVRDGAEARA